MNRIAVFLAALLWALFCAQLYAQNDAQFRSDSLEVKLDSLITLSDTLAIETDEGVDTTISYSADHIYFDVNRRMTVLTGQAAIAYKEMQLTAGRIEVDWENQILTASPVPDTVFTDSTRTAIDTVIMQEFPHFQQGSDDFTGDEIAYNLDTKIGRVKRGRTKYQDGEYFGEQFKRVDEDVITVSGGAFSTCELDTPHYHFASKTLKIIVKKRVIARPVIVYFNDVPVMAAPYGVFPSQSGRTSGIIIPTFGESAGEGRFLRDMGYYWAPSQYIDVLSTMDYFEKFGILGRSTFRYAKQYSLSGSSSFYFDTQRRNNSKNRNFQLTSRHNQSIDPNTQLNVSASYVSNKQFNDDVGSVNDRLNQSVQSNATLSKSWDNSPWSVSANLGYTQNIQAETWTANLPRIRLTHKSGELFPAPKAPRGLRGAVAPKESRTPWYRAFKWSYDVDYQNDYSYPKRPKEEGLRLEPVTLSGLPGTPTKIMGTDSSTVFKRDGISHSGSFSANAKLARYFNLNPSLSWNSDWVSRVVRYSPYDRLLDRDDELGFFTRTTFSLGTTMNTKLYGMAHRPLGIGASFRHTMTPSVGFRYRPDFADEKWGYYETVTMPDGRAYTYDRFTASEMSSNIGSTPKGLSESFSFGLQHLFQMKTGDPEAKTEKKFDLLNASMNTGMDVKRDSLKWDDLRMSFRSGIPGKLIGPFESLTFDVNTVHSFYEHNENNSKINKFFWESENASWYSPLEITSMGANAGISFRAKTLESLFEFGASRVENGPDSLTVFSEAQRDSVQSEIPFDTHLAPSQSVRDMPPAPQAEEGEGPSQLYQMPLDVNLTFHQTRDFLRSTTTSNSLSSSINFGLTPRWTTSMNFILNLDDMMTDNASVTITRDLHCWEASFRWSPLGFNPGYFLRIGLRSPQLQDVKLERHRGGNIGGFY